MSENDATESFERSYYTFDSFSDGYVDITENKTVVYFPECKEVLKTVPKNCNIYLNNILIFSFKWLPIMSLNDYYKIIDMFAKCLYNLENVYIPHTSSPYRAFSKLVTNLNVRDFMLYILEEKCNTSIQITNRQITECELTSCFQIFLGNTMLFCSARDLKGLSREETLYFLGCILHKIIY